VAATARCSDDLARLSVCLSAGRAISDASARRLLALPPPVPRPSLLIHTAAASTRHAPLRSVHFSLLPAAASANAGSTLGPGRGQARPSKSPPKFSGPQVVARPPNIAVRLIVRKISKFDATRCQIFRLKCKKFDFPRARWGSLPPDP